MPDERQDSIRQGIHAPDESPIGAAAEEERQKKVAQDPPIDSAMGGSSDASRPADEAQLNAARAASEGEGAGAEAQPADRVVEETREAGLRSQGGGSSDEEEIRSAARDETPGD